MILAPSSDRSFKFQLSMVSILPALQTAVDTVRYPYSERVKYGAAHLGLKEGKT